MEIHFIQPSKLELNQTCAIVKGGRVIFTGKYVKAIQYGSRTMLRFENDKAEYSTHWTSDAVNYVLPEHAPLYIGRTTEEINTEKIEYHSSYEGGR